MSSVLKPVADRYNQKTQAERYQFRRLPRRPVEGGRRALIRRECGFETKHAVCRLPFAVVCLPHSARRFIVRFLPAGFLCPLLCVCRLASVVSWLPVRCVVVCFSAGCPQPASLRRRFSARRFVSAAPPSAAICEKAFRP